MFENYCIKKHSNLSTYIGDATQIGLECESGNITDCNESLSIHQNSEDLIPNGCEKNLFFGNNTGQCGTYCHSNSSDQTFFTSRSQKSFLRSGWTIYTRWVSFINYK